MRPRNIIMACVIGGSLVAFAGCASTNPRTDSASASSFAAPTPARALVLPTGTMLAHTGAHGWPADATFAPHTRHNPVYSVDRTPAFRGERIAIIDTRDQLWTTNGRPRDNYFKTTRVREVRPAN